MAKKKVNRNRIPVSFRDYNIEQLKQEATRSIVMQEWAVVLAALTSFHDTTKEVLFNFLELAERTPTKICSNEDADKFLRAARDIAGVAPNMKKLNANIRSQGDLDRLKRNLKINAVCTAFCIILEPVLSSGVWTEEECRIIIQKVVSMNEEIEDGALTVQDIQDMLIDEYDLYLEEENGRYWLADAVAHDHPGA